MGLPGVTRVRVKLVRAGVIAILKAPGVQADLARRGEAIRSSLPTDAGEEWKSVSFLGFDRAQTIVKTANFEARATATHNVLQQALDRGR